MQRNTLFLIFGISAVCALLIVISSSINNRNIEAELQKRNERNALQEIIDITKNQHPVINDQLKNKIIVINVWASWCGPCKKEMPELNRLAKDFKSPSVAFIALDDEDSTEALEGMKGKLDFDYQLFFRQDKVLKVLRSFLLPSENGIPVNVIIGRDGKIAHLHVGNNPEEVIKMRDYLKKEIKNIKTIEFRVGF